MERVYPLNEDSKKVSIHPLEMELYRNHLQLGRWEAFAMNKDIRLKLEIIFINLIT